MEGKRKNQNNLRVKNGYMFEYPPLGKGNFGEVYRAIDSKTGKNYAIKKLNRNSIDNDPKSLKMYKTEKTIMSSINHPNILRLYDSFEDASHYYFVLRYCRDGTIADWIQTKMRGRLRLSRCTFFLKQIMNGFQELYRCGVMHRDFKPDNIFLDMNKLVVVIGDFGLSTFNAKKDLDFYVGIPVYMAPEILEKRGHYSSKVDLWQIGVTFYEMLFGQRPFNHKTIPGLLNIMKYQSGANLKFPIQLVSKEERLAADLLKKLLVFEPTLRISWQQFFQHPLFKTNHNIDEGRNKDEQTSRIQDNVNELFTSNIMDGVENIEFEEDPDKIMEVFESKILSSPLKEENKDFGRRDLKKQASVQSNQRYDKVQNTLFSKNPKLHNQFSMNAQTDLVNKESPPNKARPYRRLTSKMNDKLVNSIGLEKNNIIITQNRLRKVPSSGPGYFHRVDSPVQLNKSGSIQIGKRMPAKVSNFRPQCIKQVHHRPTSQRRLNVQRVQQIGNRRYGTPLTRGIRNPIHQNSLHVNAQPAYHSRSPRISSRRIFSNAIQIDQRIVNGGFTLRPSSRNGGREMRSARRIS